MLLSHRCEAKLSVCGHALVTSKRSQKVFVQVMPRPLRPPVNFLTSSDKLLPAMNSPKMTLSRCLGGASVPSRYSSAEMPQPSFMTMISPVVGLIATWMLACLASLKALSSAFTIASSTILIQPGLT